MSRKIMQQALEALDEAVGYVESSAMSPSMANECRDAIYSLRTALAAPQGEAVARLHFVGADTYFIAEAEVLAVQHLQGKTSPVDVYLAPPAAPSVPAGWKLVPVEPTQAHLNSIAMRHDHRFGLLPPEQQENARSFARQMYEECIGRGFYKIDAAPSVTYGSIAERAADGKGAGLWPPAAPSGEEEVTRLVRWLTAPRAKGTK